MGCCYLFASIDSKKEVKSNVKVKMELGCVDLWPRERRRVGKPKTSIVLDSIEAVEFDSTGSLPDFSSFSCD